MPFDLLGFDTDNDSVFMNETIRDYCCDLHIAFTRCRPYRKNDQAFEAVRSPNMFQLEKTLDRPKRGR
jgi:hypothetical protein